MVYQFRKIILKQDYDVPTYKKIKHMLGECDKALLVITCIILD